MLSASLFSYVYETLISTLSSAKQRRRNDEIESFKLCVGVLAARQTYKVNDAVQWDSTADTHIPTHTYISTLVLSYSTRIVRILYKHGVSKSASRKSTYTHTYKIRMTFTSTHCLSHTPSICNTLVTAYAALLLHSFCTYAIFLTLFTLLYYSCMCMCVW